MTIQDKTREHHHSPEGAVLNRGSVGGQGVQDAAVRTTGESGASIHSCPASHSKHLRIEIASHTDV